jgi:hypothetical protein
MDQDRVISPVQDLDERGGDDVLWDIVERLFVAWYTELLASAPRAYSIPLSTVPLSLP